MQRVLAVIEGVRAWRLLRITVPLEFTYVSLVELKAPRILSRILTVMQSDFVCEGVTELATSILLFIVINTIGESYLGAASTFLSFAVSVSDRGCVADGCRRI